MIAIQNQTHITNLLVFDRIATSIPPRPKSNTLIFDYPHRHGTRIDVHNIWRRIEVPVDESRTDIAKACRLGKCFE
jgi:hypothetical protein